MWACVACKPFGFNIYDCLGGNQTEQSTYAGILAIRKNVRENCRALIVRGYDEWGRRSIAFGLQCTAFDRVLVLYEKHST